MRILAISGSLRRDSHNTGLLRAAANLLPPGVQLISYDHLEEIPPFNEDRLEHAPRAVQQLRAIVAQAEGVLISAPEYNSSIPGVLKNALDWLSRPLAESPLRTKPTAVVGASTGMFGAIWAQAEARKVLSAIGARVLDRELPVAAAHEQVRPDGTLTDQDLALELGSILEALAHAVSERAQLTASPSVP